MAAISYSAVRANRVRAINWVCDGYEPVIITCSELRSVVMLSQEDSQALEETVYLLRCPVYASRLLAVVAQLQASEGVERDLTP